MKKMPNKSNRKAVFRPSFVRCSLVSCKCSVVFTILQLQPIETEVFFVDFQPLIHLRSTGSINKKIQKAHRTMGYVNLSG